MEQRKLESIAAREGDTPDRFVAALSTPGQLLVVSARYPAPSYLREYLIKGDYKSASAALAASGEPDDKFFVQDLGAEGLHPDRVKDRPFDIIYGE